MIVRLILLFIVVDILMWLLKRLFVREPDPQEIEHKDDLNTEEMRQCKFCGIHVPESSIILCNDNPYCCQDHADRDQQ